MIRLYSVFTLIAFLGACGESDSGKNSPVASSQTTDTLTEVDPASKTLKAVNLKADITPCVPELLGAVVYVISEDTFYHCESNDWSPINLKGPEGKQGIAGKDGVDGKDGADGVSGGAGGTSLNFVTSITPNDGVNSHASTAGFFEVTFAGQMDGDTINSDTIKIINKSTDSEVSALVHYEQVGSLAKIYPLSQLDFGTRYEIQIGTGIENFLGAAQQLTVKHDFKTNYKISKLSTHGSHSCALSATGYVKCWGVGGDGELGNGNGNYNIQELHQAKELIFKSENQQLLRVIDIAVGAVHSCAITSDKAMWCWGEYIAAGLGSDAVSPTKINWDNEYNFKSVFAGGKHNCAILEDDTVRCWGNGAGHALGYGSIAIRKVGAEPTGLGTVKSLALGEEFSCAIKTDDSVACWGRSNTYQTGLGSSFDQSSPANVDLGVGRTALSITAHWRHACALLDDNSVKCWGYGANGQLGDGGTTANPTPGPVNLGGPAKGVSAGSDHTCAVMMDDSLKCWGANTSGQLGTNTEGASSPEPASVSLRPGETVKKVFTGSAFTCIQNQDDVFKCFGQNNDGRLGINDGDLIDFGEIRVPSLPIQW